MDVAADRPDASPRTPRRNPPWAADELILALDLYVRFGLLDDSAAEVIELSSVLNALPIHTVRPDVERFRNPNGVALKLANFAALDPGYAGRGMTRGGRRDAEVWQRFGERPDELQAVAAAIRQGVEVAHPFPLSPEEDEDGIDEGRLLYRRHRSRERNPTLVRRRKQQAMLRDGFLACEVCGFDFEERYGDVGRDFIECHHLRPLADSGVTRTRLADLALLCSNCHRMAHRMRPWPTIGEMRHLLRSPHAGP
jgi:5-methylcytosine-specific restriction protein A